MYMGPGPLGNPSIEEESFAHSFYDPLFEFLGLEDYERMFGYFTVIFSFSSQKPKIETHRPSFTYKLDGLHNEFRTKKLKKGIYAEKSLSFIKDMCSLLIPKEEV